LVMAGFIFALARVGLLAYYGETGLLAIAAPILYGQSAINFVTTSFVDVGLYFMYRDFKRQFEVRQQQLLAS